MPIDNGCPGKPARFFLNACPVTLVFLNDSLKYLNGANQRACYGNEAKVNDIYLAGRILGINGHGYLIVELRKSFRGDTATSIISRIYGTLTTKKAAAPNWRLVFSDISNPFFVSLMSGLKRSCLHKNYSDFM